MAFICFDTEDDSKELLAAGKSGFDKRVTQIAAITRAGKRYYCPGDVKDFKRWLRQQKERRVYAHNVQYDLGNLFRNELDQLDCTLVNGRMIKAVWPVPGSSDPIIFLDSFNMWPMSAAKLAPAFGMEKLATDSMATDKAYVFRDVEIIHRAMCFAWDIAEALGLKYLPATLGGLGIKAWKIWGGANCHDSLEISRQALYGGRVELFKVHNEARIVPYCDLNSLYPAMMKKGYPDLMEDCGKKLPAYGVADCLVSVPRCEIAPLPFRSKEGRILYPWGKFRGVWCVNELANAVEHGSKILKVHRAYGSDEAIFPYGEFVDRGYAARLQAKSDAERLFFKLLLNTVFGRVGCKGVISRSVYQTEKNRFDGVPYGSKVLVNYQMPLAEETNWCHQSYITAYGRIELFKYLVRVGAERLIYCDTDSVIFDCPDILLCGSMGWPAVPPWYFSTGWDLGQMKLESLERHAIAYAPKMYQLGRKYRAKGVPVKLAQAFIEQGHAEFDLPYKFREAIAFYDRENSKALSVWRAVQKFKRTGYDRKILKNNRFYPCQINQC